MNAFETRIDIFRTYGNSGKKEIRVVLFLTQVFSFLFSKTGIFLSLGLLIYPIPLLIFYKYQNPVFLYAAPVGHILGFLWVVLTSPEFEKNHSEFNNQILALKELYRSL